jgi:hypothetical protein
LSSLPESIRQLVNLTRLRLNHNNFTIFPKEICQLTNLESLVFYNNNLTNIPKEIGNLTRLESLELQFNKLIDLPEEIGELTNLTYLNLENNNLSNLPKINNLVNLEELHLAENPWTQKIKYDNFPRLSQYSKDRLYELNEEIRLEAPIRRGKTIDLLLQAKQKEIPIQLKNGKISGDAKNYYVLNENNLNSDIMGFLGYEDAKNPKPPARDTYINNAINKAKAESSSDAKGGKRSRKTVRRSVRRTRRSTRRRNKK